MWKAGLVCTAFVALPAMLASQEARSEVMPKQESTELRLHVTGGDEAVAVKGATVYLEWKEEGETKNREGTTNAEGIAGPYRLPRAKVFVQITTGDEKWETYGSDHELTEAQQTIKISLKKRPQES